MAFGRSLISPLAPQSLEGLEDAAVLMRKALEHSTITHSPPVIVQAEHILEGLAKPKKEKKSRRSKLGSKSLCARFAMIEL